MSKKKLFFSIFFSLFLGIIITSAQNKTLPNNLKVRQIDQDTWVSLDDLVNKEGATIISFWATWCKPCITELNTINEEYLDWQDETNVKLIAISIDDKRSSERVKPFVDTRGWDFETFIDLNGDVNRAMGVNSIVPYTFVLDKQGKIVYTHTSYIPGDEEEYYDVISKIAKGEEIKK